MYEFVNSSISRSKYMNSVNKNIQKFSFFGNIFLISYVVLKCDFKVVVRVTLVII